MRVQIPPPARGILLPVIELEVRDLSVEVWANPGTSIPRDRRDELFGDLWELVRDGFAQIADVAGDADVEKFLLGADVGIYLYDGDRCRAVFMVDAIDLGSERVLYLSLAAVHSSLRGRGMYLPMVLLRLALGRLWECTWWATRTASPLVAETFGRFDPYPWRDDERSRAAAAELGLELRSRFSVGDTPADHEFDARTGVLVASYPVFPYQDLPAGGGDRVMNHFERHVDHERGDALLLLGPLDGAIDQLAPRCEELLGRPFSSLVDSLSSLHVEH